MKIGDICKKGHEIKSEGDLYFTTARPTGICKKCFRICQERNGWKQRQKRRNKYQYKICAGSRLDGTKCTQYASSTGFCRDHNPSTNNKVEEA